MNERIRQLAEQARQYAESKMHLTGVKDSAAYDEKFAELIVRECWTTISPFIEDDELAEDALAEIKEHFGVEE